MQQTTHPWELHLSLVPEVWFDANKDLEHLLFVPMHGAENDCPNIFDDLLQLPAL